MWQRRIFLKSHRRQPVSADNPVGMADAQAAAPAAWCCRCGKEVYQKDMSICLECKEETEDEESL